MVQSASVPEPPVRSTVTVRAVLVKAEIGPSMKLAGVAAEATRTRWPTAKAVAVATRLVVKLLEPVPTATEDALVRPA